MLRRFALVLSVLALVVTACGGGDDAAPDSPDGFQTFAGDGFSVGFPSGWQVITPGDLDVEGILDEGLTELGLDPGAMSDALTAQFAGGARVFAFDFDGSSEGFVDNFNVLEGPVPPFGAAELLDLNLDQMEQAGWTVAESEVRTFPAGEGFFMRFDFGPGVAARGALSTTIITEEAQWVLTFTASDPDRARADFDLIADSFRVE